MQLGNYIVIISAMIKTTNKTIHKNMKNRYLTDGSIITQAISTNRLPPGMAASFMVLKYRLPLRTRDTAALMMTWLRKRKEISIYY